MKLPLENSLDERTRALFGPRDLKEKGSPQWCWQTVERLKLLWSQMNDDERQVAAVLQEIEQYRAWEKVPPERPYGSLSALLEAEIGKPEAEVRNHVEEIRVLRKREIGVPNGKPGPGRGKKTNVNNTRFTVGSGNAEYLTARLARDHPAILDRMKAGEFKSVRQAALQAGIIKPRISIALDPHKAAETILRHFSPAEVHLIIKELHRGS